MRFNDLAILALVAAANLGVNARAVLEARNAMILPDGATVLLERNPGNDPSQSHDA
jgi:hypothetical protein